MTLYLLTTAEPKGDPFLLLLVVVFFGYLIVLLAGSLDD